MSQPTYTLYLDTCGDPGWFPPNGRSKIKYYVVAGLALTPSNDMEAYTEVNRILDSYVSPWSMIGQKAELCYHHLIRGKGIYSNLEHIQRLKMADEVFALLLHLKPVLFATVVDKVRMKQRYGIDAHDPKLLGIRATIHRFAMFLKRQANGIGNVMMDAEEYRKDHAIQEMVRTFKTTGIIIRGWSYQPMYEEKLDRILNTIAFADSVTSTGIQLADVCCRTTWQHFESKKSNRFNQISPLWNGTQYRTYEPSVIPK
jgi:hypothetical protein